jgi:hypothetical protein
LTAKKYVVLKINHAERNEDRLAQIRKAAAGLPATILARTIDCPDVVALMNCRDGLVSLHRSEGFGPRKPCLGKPAIANPYCSNLDFAREDNCFLVRFEMTTVPSGCDLFPQGACWADPDVVHAAEPTRSAAQSAETPAERARRGRQFVKSELAPSVAGGVMKRRLKRLRLE